ncbi:MAG: hypothetical protein ACXVXP_00480 [Mycobacteriaceae bacterium]
MKYAYVGVTPRHLASGRPLVFGDAVDASELSREDAPLAEWLVTDEREPEAPADTPEASGPESTTPEAK